MVTREKRKTIRTSLIIGGAILVAVAAVGIFTMGDKTAEGIAKTTDRSVEKRMPLQPEVINKAANEVVNSTGQFKAGFN